MKAVYYSLKIIWYSFLFLAQFWGIWKFYSFIMIFFPYGQSNLEGFLTLVGCILFWIFELFVIAKTGDYLKDKYNMEYKFMEWVDNRKKRSTYKQQERAASKKQQASHRVKSSVTKPVVTTQSIRSTPTYQTPIQNTKPRMTASMQTQKSVVKASSSYTECEHCGRINYHCSCCPHCDVDPCFKCNSNEHKSKTKVYNHSASNDQQQRLEREKKMKLEQAASIYRSRTSYQDEIEQIDRELGRSVTEIEHEDTLYKRYCNTCRELEDDCRCCSNCDSYPCNCCRECGEPDRSCRCCSNCDSYPCNCCRECGEPERYCRCCSRCDSYPCNCCRECGEPERYCRCCSRCDNYPCNCCRECGQPDRYCRCD